MPGEVKRSEWHFLTPVGCCDLGQQADLYTKTIRFPWRCWTFKNYDMVLRSLPPSLICAICVIWPAASLSNGFKKLHLAEQEKCEFPICWRHNVVQLDILIYFSICRFSSWFVHSFLISFRLKWFPQNVPLEDTSKLRKISGFLACKIFQDPTYVRHRISWAMWIVVTIF